MVREVYFDMKKKKKKIFFFFQAEDGIRDTSVTGVQTCALPIFCYKVAYPWYADQYPTKNRPSHRAHSGPTRPYK